MGADRLTTIDLLPTLFDRDKTLLKAATHRESELNLNAITAQYCRDAVRSSLGENIELRPSIAELHENVSEMIFVPCVL
jgi:hypothetical protein